jgi:heme/copper-type cytochrome/quinol oxidase subunit 3
VNDLAIAATGSHRVMRWRLAALLGAAAVIALTFWIVAALPYFTLDREHFGAHPDVFWPRRYPLLLHIGGGTIALLAGPLQLWLGETRRQVSWHRKLGKLYVSGVTVGALAAYFLALTSTAPFGWVYASGLFGLAVAWTITTGMAYVAIRRRAIEQHREWMIRSYVVTLAFVFFRLLVVILERLDIGEPMERYMAAAWMCWAVPLLITEPWLQLRKPHAAQGSAA